MKSNRKAKSSISKAEAWLAFARDVTTRKVKVHLPPPDCKCGHTWEDHHHGCIMNLRYPSEDHRRGICRGVMAQECEAEQFESKPLVKDACYCSQYKIKKSK